MYDDAEVVLGLLLPGTSTATSSVILGRVCAFWWLSVVFLLNMCVEGRITQIALATAADEGASDIVILGTALVA